MTHVVLKIKLTIQNQHHRTDCKRQLHKKISDSAQQDTWCLTRLLYAEVAPSRSSCLARRPSEYGMSRCLNFPLTPELTLSIKWAKVMNACSTFTLMCADVSTIGIGPALRNSLRESMCSTSAAYVRTSSSFLVVVSTTGFFVFASCASMHDTYSACLFKGLWATSLTSNMHMKPSIDIRPSGNKVC